MLGVEMAHRGDFTVAALQGLLGEKVARLRTQFATDDIFIYAFVARDSHLGEVGLLALHNAHLQIDAIAHDVHLDGGQAVEDVAVVVIKVADGVLVGQGTLFDVRLVVDVALVHIKDSLQEVGRIHRVAHPLDVAHIVFLAFFQMDVDVHHVVLAGCRHHTVCGNHGVTEAQLGIFFLQIFLGLLVAAVHELMVAEPVAPALGLTNLAQDTFLEQAALDGALREIVIAEDVDFVDLHLLLFVHIDVQSNLVGMSRIVVLLDDQLCVLVALLVEIAMSENLCTVQHIGRQLVFLHQSELFFQIFALALLHAVVGDGRDTGALGQEDVQVGRIRSTVVCAAHNTVHLHGDIGEQTVAPEAANGLRNLLAGELHRLADAQAGEAHQKLLIKVFHAVHLNAADDAFTGRTGIVNRHRRVSLRELSPNEEGHEAKG